MVEFAVLGLTDDPIGYIAERTGTNPLSHLIILPTARNIRHFYSTLSELNEGKALIAPSCMEANEFIRQSLDSGGKALIDRSLRPFYLHLAISRIDQAKLDEIFRESGRGFREDFLRFASTGLRILRFYDEICAERIDPADLRNAALYTDYEKHVSVLEEIAGEYEKVLAEDGYTDPMFLKKNGSIRTEWTGRFERITFLAGGYLTNFELELLSSVSEISRLCMVLRYEGEPDRQTRKIFRHFSVEQVSMPKVSYPPALEIKSFDEISSQFGFIISSIEKVLRMNIAPEEIAVVLGDENMKRVLYSLDRRRIFNYAMGLDFRGTSFFSFFKSVQELFSDRPGALQYHAAAVIAFLKHPFIRAAGLVENRSLDAFIREVKERNRLILSEREFCRSEPLEKLFIRIRSLLSKETGYSGFLLSAAELIRDVLDAAGEAFRPVLENPEFREARNKLFTFLYQSASLPFDRIETGRDPLDHLDYLLDRLAELTFNDVAGGFITVMGMLETRNLSFRAVIIPDMNEEILPARNEKDMFLNTAIRETLGIPSHSDRDSLARNYFSGLVKNSEMAFLSYISRDDRRIRSRFIEEILIRSGHTGEDQSRLKAGPAYRNLLFFSGKHAAPTELEPIAKSEKILKELRRMSYSPSGLRTYRQCRLKFYLKYCSGLKEPAELREELSPLDIGNILHSALKSCYSEDANFATSGELYSRLRQAVLSAAEAFDLLKLSPEAAFGMEVLLDKLYAFSENEVRRLEEGWKPEFLEYKVSADFDGVTLAGRVDRLDLREKGGKKEAFIIDYKFSNTGRYRNFRYNREFTEFQLPLYRHILKERHPELEVTGFGYYDLKDRFDLVTVTEQDSPAAFREMLGELLGEILSPGKDFGRTEDLKQCGICGFARICGRQKL